MAGVKKDEVVESVESNKVKVRLRFPTVGHKRGDVIEVEKAQADALVANGNAYPA